MDVSLSHGVWQTAHNTHTPYVVENVQSCCMLGAASRDKVRHVCVRSRKLMRKLHMIVRE